MKIKRIFYWLACLMAASNIIDVIMVFVDGAYTVNEGWLVRFLLSIVAWIVVIIADEPSAKKKVVHLLISCVAVVAMSVILALLTVAGFVVLSL